MPLPGCHGKGCTLPRITYRNRHQELVIWEPGFGSTRLLSGPGVRAGGDPDSGGGGQVVVVTVVVSQFNGTSTPKAGVIQYAKPGDNDCNVNSNRYSLSTALRESNSLSGQV